MTKQNEIIAEIVRKLYQAAIPRSDSYAATHKKNTVIWRIYKDGWCSVRCISVTEYSPSCFRFRNDGWNRIPKQIWPFSTRLIQDLQRMEITVHHDEINEQMMDMIVSLASDLESAIDSEVFRPDMRSVHYAWTNKAWFQQEQNRKGK